jgi:hypothetical protein
MNFTFNPNAAGSFSATLSVDSSTAGYSTLFIPLTGAGIAAPAASFSPTTLAFPSTGIGASSATQSITLTSSGGAALTLTSIVTGGANPSSFIQNNNCGTVNAGASCTITVTFKPAAAGALSATLSFADNAANSPQAVTLTGTGVAPTVSVSPTGLAFGTTATGTLATSQIVTLKNTGSVALSISGISINGTNSSVFTQTNTCAATLAASASCTVTVTFKPAAASAYTASLSVADNAAASPQAVPLTGTGVLLAPSVTLSASALSFPATSAATAGTVNYSPAQAITLTNSGNGPLTISSIALSGTNPASFTQMNNCPASLPAAASCTALLRFAPTAASSLTATLTFTGNASPTTQSVTLSGSGVSAPTYTLSSSTLAFGSVNSGAISAVQTVTLTNTGTAAPLNLTSIALSGTGAAAFTQVNNCPASLSAGAKCTLLAQFAPTAKSAAAASLTFTFNNPSASAVVALTGTGQ